MTGAITCGGIIPDICICICGGISPGTVSAGIAALEAVLKEVEALGFLTPDTGDDANIRKVIDAMIKALDAASAASGGTAGALSNATAAVLRDVLATEEALLEKYLHEVSGGDLVALLPKTMREKGFCLSVPNFPILGLAFVERALEYVGPLPGLPFDLFAALHFSSAWLFLRPPHARSEFSNSFEQTVTQFGAILNSNKLLLNLGPICYSI